MSVLELSAMTWEEVRDLDRAKAVAILPTGALEAHGPHLPLGTDVIIAEAMARRAAEKLSARGYHAVLLPPLEYTAAEFAAAFPGTVSLRPSTVTALVVDVASSLGRHGFPVRPRLEATSTTIWTRRTSPRSRPPSPRAGITSPEWCSPTSRRSRGRSA